MNPLKKYNYVFLIFATVIIVFFLFFLYPDYKIAVEKEEEIQLLHRKIEKQELLYPLYEALSKELDRLEGIDIVEGFDTDSGTECESRQVISDIRKLIQEHPFTVSMIHSNVDTDRGDQMHLTLSIDLKGKFMDIQNLLFQMAQLTCVKSIEQVSVKSSQPNQTIRLKVWIIQTS